ncbi:MAG TPA: LysR family transcriptional regulator [Thermoleophilaceae bacterium]
MRVLREVATQGSFSAAAEALSYTQSAVSQQIAALEREAGTKLVERNARGIRLTDAGEALVRHTEAVLANLAEAEAELEALAGVRGGRVRLASFPSAGSAIIPQAIANFRARHPAVELNLIEAEPQESLPRLRSGELEIALTYTPGMYSDESLAGVDTEDILDDPFYLVLPAGHPLAAKPRVRLKDLASEPWITGTDACPCTGQVQWACTVAGFEPHVAFESDDFATVQGLVAAGVGVALIPDLGFATARDDIVVRELHGSDRMTRTVQAATLPGYRSPATQAMLDVLRDTAAGYRSARVELAAAS